MTVPHTPMAEAMTVTTNVSERSAPEGGSSPASTRPADGIASGRAAPPRRKRIPMSVPHAQLEVPEVPGYRLYWHKEQNVGRALDAGYEFVLRDEVNLNRREIGGHSSGSANTDLGSQVSFVSGTDQRGDPQRLVLMKIPLEFFKEDQMKIAEDGARRVGQIFSDEQMIGPDGQINDRGALVYTPSEGMSAHLSGRSPFLPALNRPKRTAKTLPRPRFAGG